MALLLFSTHANVLQPAVQILRKSLWFEVWSLRWWNQHFFPRSIFPQDSGMCKKHWLFQCNCKTSAGVGPKGRDRDRGTDSVKCFLFSKALAGYEIRLDRWRVNGLGWSAEPFVEVVLLAWAEIQTGWLGRRLAGRQVKEASTSIIWSCRETVQGEGDGAVRV